jgi:hypothetical protein
MLERAKAPAVKKQLVLIGYLEPVGSLAGFDRSLTLLHDLC